ncbi:MAG TPA: condensation domain-containing protein, partial [Thermoanaerobaculia bacterium]|nr:condensation domain-containing protein [Thermoanaerobaculia bacterium]
AGDIAIVGLAGRFPGARDVDELWDNLSGGVEAVSRFSDEELRAAGVDSNLLGNPRYVRARGVLADADLFDAAFFEVPPLQAGLMDPQLRVFLECAWEALEDAGYDPSRMRDVGLYAGVTTSTYFLNNLLSNPRLLAAVGGYQAAIGVDRDYLTTQVSYKLGLTGPSVNVQTACSTSLVALHLACQALRAGECEMALAGGVSIKVPQVSGYLYQEGGIDSATGRCRAFDAQADGTVWGSGVGLVVLKRLEDALAAGDAIRAVVRGSAINNDGLQKVGYTAPSVEAQAAVIAAAQAAAGIEPESVTYLEAHGTGTQLGDPIEVAAASRAFRAGTDRTGFCAIGSVKSNLGHLGAAAGIAGLIKAVLALEHREIPPTLHFETPNPAIDFASSPFYVATAPTPWQAGSGPLRAGVSSFGLGGTNAHVVLEEAPAAAPSTPARPWQLLVLSARDEAALESATEGLADWLERYSERPQRLADAAWTLQMGRRRFAHRRTVVCRDAAEAREALRRREGRDAVQEGSRRPVAFLFPGQGSQHAGMARGLYETEEVFRREIDACAEILAPQLGRDLRDWLLRADAEELRQTRWAQPALFAVEYALARLWLSWGIEPWAMIGHSLGEYVAACLAGVFSLEDALELVAARGELMQSLPAGAMLSVELPESGLDLAGSGLALAAVNGPSLSVVSGPEEAVAAFEAALAARGLACRRLHTSHAFHSAMMDPILDAFAARVGKVALAPPSRPYLSNLTGTWITAGQATDPRYWVRHLREAVRFGDGVARLLAEAPEGGVVLLEVGPGRTLSHLVRGQSPEGAVASMRHPKDDTDDQAALLEALGRLWLAGAEIDWAAMHAGESLRRVPLPTYPFQRRRFWVEPNTETARDEPGEWLYTPSWRRIRLPAAGTATAGRWLLAGDRSRVSEILAARLAARGCEVVRTLSGDRLPDKAVFLWGLDETRARPGAALRALLALAGELESAGAAGVEVCAVSSGLHDITGEEALPERAPLLAACRLIPQRHSGLACRSVDVAVPRTAAAVDQLADLLFDELSRGADPVVAYNARGQRWVRGQEPVPAAGPEAPASAGGTCLVMGELNGWGKAVSELLAWAGLDRVDAGPAGRPPEVTGIIAVAEAASAEPEAALAAVEQRMRAVREAVREHEPGFCLVIASPAGGPAAAATAAYAEHFAVRESHAGGTSWIAVSLAADLPGDVAAGALRRALGRADVPQIWVEPPAGWTPAVDLETPTERRPEPGRAVPRTDLEARIAQMFELLLGVPDVGIHDDFFELGGHSLLGTRLISRLRDDLEVELPLELLFESPTPAALAAAVEAGRRAAAAPDAALPPIEPAPRDGEIPLSFAQERLWFLDQLTPGSAAYNIPAAVRLTGRLDAAALRQALDEVARRHEVLRTTFPQTDGRPSQLVHPPRPFVLPVVDLTDLMDSREAEALRLAAEEPRQPFDLTRGPLLRAVLLRLGEREHLLPLTMHHIVSDAWSRGIFVREVGTLYRAFASGEASPLPDLPVQYADYAVWQRNRLAGGVLDELTAYWRQGLAGVPSVLELPADRPRPAAGGSRAAQHRWTLPVASAAALDRLARRQGSTLFMVLLAGFDALLWRYSGQERFNVGSPIAGRLRAEVEDLIGLFINTLVLSADLSGDPTALDLIARVRDTALGAYAHQEMPFERLVSELQPERDLDRTPLFQVMLVLQNAPAGPLEAAGLNLEPLAVESGAAKFDLTLSVFEGEAGLGFVLEYNRDLYDPATAERMAGHLGLLLEGMAAAPERRIAEQPLLTEAERRQLFLEWNG